jgi:hypothetical protein
MRARRSGSSQAPRLSVRFRIESNLEAESAPIVRCLWAQIWGQIWKAHVAPHAQKLALPPQVGLFLCIRHRFPSAPGNTIANGRFQSCGALIGASCPPHAGVPRSPQSALWARRTLFLAVLPGGSRSVIPRHPPALPACTNVYNRNRPSFVAIEWHGRCRWRLRSLPPPAVTRVQAIAAPSRGACPGRALRCARFPRWP